MKNLRILGISLLIFSLPFYADAMGVLSTGTSKKEVKAKYHRRGGGHHGGGHHGRGHGNPVGAPLDGGLLTILGAAGIGYYLIRKKKKAVVEE